MKKLNEKMIKRYGEIYKRMYDNEEDTFEKARLFDEKFEIDIDFKDLVSQYNKVTKRLIDSDRECAAWYEMYNEEEITIKVNNNGEEKEISGYSYKDIEDNLLSSDYMNKNFIWSYIEHYIGGRTYKYLNKNIFRYSCNKIDFLKKISKKEYLGKDFINTFIKYYLEDLGIDDKLRSYLDDNKCDETCDIYSNISCDYCEDIDNDVKIFILNSKLSQYLNKESLKKYLSYNEYNELLENNKLDNYLKELDNNVCRKKVFINKNYDELKYDEYENVFFDIESEYYDMYYDDYLKDYVINDVDEDMIEYLIEYLENMDELSIDNLFDIFVDYHNIELVDFEEIMDVYDYDNNEELYIEDYDYRCNL